MALVMLRLIELLTFCLHSVRQKIIKIGTHTAYHWVW